MASVYCLRNDQKVRTWEAGSIIIEYVRILCEHQPKAKSTHFIFSFYQTESHSKTWALKIWRKWLASYLLKFKEKVWQEFADWILKYSSWHGKPETNYITCKSFSLALVKFVSLWFFVSFCSSFSFIGLNIFYTIIHISWLCPFTFFSPYQVAFLFIYFSFLSVFKKLILLFLSAFFLFETVT